MSVTGTFTKTGAVTALPTTGEFREDPTDGSLVPVLDVSRISFDNAVWGEKKTPTLVMRAHGGEATFQRFNGKIESEIYYAEEGDAIFMNNPEDHYVPSDKARGRMKFDDLEKHGYRITAVAPDHVLVVSPPAKMIPAIIDARVCIPTKRLENDGDQEYQFLSAGATLKLSLEGKVSGMDAAGFAKWETGAQYAPALAPS